MGVKDQDLKIETEEVVRIMVELVHGLQILHQVVVQDLAQEGLIVVVGSTVAQIHAIGITSTKEKRDDHHLLRDQGMCQMSEVPRQGN